MPNMLMIFGGVSFGWVAIAMAAVVAVAGIVMIALSWKESRKPANYREPVVPEPDDTPQWRLPPR